MPLRLRAMAQTARCPQPLSTLRVCVRAAAIGSLLGRVRMNPRSLQSRGDASEGLISGVLIRADRQVLVDAPGDGSFAARPCHRAREPILNDEVTRNPSPSHGRAYKLDN